MTILRVSILLLLTTLVGCASYPEDKIFALIEQGKCKEAAQLVNSRPSDKGRMYLYLAAVAGDCERNSKKANAYLDLSARYGEQIAINILINTGKKVPPQDLAARESSQQDAALAMMLNSMNATVQNTFQNNNSQQNNSQQYKPLFCSSKAKGMGTSKTVDTTCF